MPRLPLPSRGGGRLGRRPQVRLRHAGVLDGRTLTLNGTLPAARAGDGLRVVLRRGEDRREAPLTPVADPDGTARFAAAIALGPGGIALAPGRWVVGIETAAGAELALSADGAIPDDDGPTLANPRSPETGLRITPRATEEGLVVAVRRPKPHAEMDALWVRGDRVTVEGRLIGEGVPAGAVRLLATAGDASLEGPPAEIRDRGFVAAFGLEALAGTRADRWTLRLGTAGGTVRLAKDLDDVRALGEVVRFPAHVVAAGTPAATRVRPVFDERNRIQLRCQRVGTGAGA